MSFKPFQISELAEQVRGVSYSKSDAKSSASDGYLPILRANNITKSGLEFDDLVYVPEDKVSKRQKLLVGDIVIAASSGSIEVVGKAAPVVQPFDGSFGAFCKALRPNEKVLPNYLAHYFQTQHYRQRISALAAGANINNLRNEHLDDLIIHLPMKNGKPDLDEQRRIASILDQADAIRRKRRQALQLTDDFLRSTFLDLFGDPVTNPKGWDRPTLKEVIKVSSGNGLTAKNMSADGKYAVYGGNGINGYHDEYMFDAPTIVLGRVGVYCGAVHMTQPKSWVTDNALYVRKLIESANDTYLLHALRFANLNQYAGRAAQPLISGSRIYPIEINLPPTDLQEHFESIVQTISQMRSKFEENLRDDLFASLQQRAFKGEL